MEAAGSPHLPSRNRRLIIAGSPQGREAGQHVQTRGMDRKDRARRVTWPQGLDEVGPQGAAHLGERQSAGWG